MQGGITLVGRLSGVSQLAMRRPRADRPARRRRPENRSNDRLPWRTGVAGPSRQRSSLRLDPAGGPFPGAHNSFRGAPLAQRDAPTRAALAALRDAPGTLDLDAAAAAWKEALQAPAWDGPLAWIHGDLLPGNLIVRQGRLRGVIDFGCLGVGEPAVDLTPAWTLFDERARAVYRTSLGVDDATWARGRGWALSFGLIALPYYRDSNPVLAGVYRRAIDRILADHP